MVIEENVVVSCQGCLNGAWQLPQWILLSLSDAIFFPSGMQFAYTQVGPQMKAFSFSIFLLTTSLGNYLVLMLEDPLQQINSDSNRQWVYILISSISFVIFVLLSKCWFVSKEDEERLKVQQTNVEIFMKPIKSESMYSLEMF
ncbi:hypothetical protein DSO57_1011081 [Entomophthora muscae]|uniref:Uncharacterized protein n=2 Tax=Entomophthora muscae TaxID=34485 RepID=A0ACC2RL95_9FUNG|nr:hypothetical protein DSO57_1010202 [Entomophthora muscae]KAJ9062404.1 hypothetical protein DSO57_1011081 [Entomophthora muscae]